MAESPLFERVTLIGIGLIGSSIARAARKHKLAKHIAIADASDEARRIAGELTLAEEATVSGATVHVQRDDITELE